jgi:hypothetical protein
MEVSWGPLSKSSGEAVHDPEEAGREVSLEASLCLVAQVRLSMTLRKLAGKYPWRPASV